MEGRRGQRVRWKIQGSFGAIVSVRCSVSDAQEYVQGHWDTGVVFDRSGCVLCMPA